MAVLDKLATKLTRDSVALRNQSGQRMRWPRISLQFPDFLAKEDRGRFWRPEDLLEGRHFKDHEMRSDEVWIESITSLMSTLASVLGERRSARTLLEVRLESRFILRKKTVWRKICSGYIL